MRRNSEQLPCGGVSIYIKKGLYHHQVQMDSRLQVVAVQVTLGGTPVTILSVNVPSSNHLTSRDPTYLTRNIRNQILIKSDFNGHSYLWGSHDVDTRGEVIEIFTDRHCLCIFNDGTHTYPKPRAQHVNRPASTIDLTISTSRFALRSVWEVLPDIHCSDHYPILIRSYHQWQRCNQAMILPTGSFTRPIGNSFMLCTWKDSLRIYKRKQITYTPLSTTKPRPQMTASQEQPPYSRYQTLGLMKKNAEKPWRLGRPWKREFHRVENGEGKPYLLSEGHRQRLGDSSTRRKVSLGRNMYQSCQLILLQGMCGIKWENYIWQKICPPKQYINGKNCTAITEPKHIANEHAAAFTDNSSSTHYNATFQAIKGQEKVKDYFRQHCGLQQTLPIEIFEAINHWG